ncbi:MAG: NAD(+)/NADH kinase [Sphaerochaetaceae bacterium]|nr:NAD(+)/NADH kinase [Sphaerochaetaceae bacterium]
MEIRKVAVFANPERRNVLNVYNKISSFLKEKGVETELVSLTSTSSDSSLTAPACDLAVSLGGDGTVLSCAWLVRGTRTPILAVNMGTFGYVAETSVAEVLDVLSSCIESRIVVEERMRLEVTVRRKGRIVFEDSALNEITVSTVSHAKMARLNLFIDGVMAANLKADGVIFATPTGSTAYSLSAGGPIVDAKIKAIIINPVSPFTISARPLVVSDSTVIEVQIPRQVAGIDVISDGHGIFGAEEGDCVTIRRSPVSSCFIQNNSRNSIEILRDKLGWAGGFNA